MNNLVMIYILGTIILGIIYGLKVKNVKEYILSSQNHSTIIIIATILGVIIGGPMVLTRSRFAYDMNLAYILGSFGTFFAILSYSYFSPLIYKKYNNKISAGEIIEESYGRNARRITGICGVILSIMFVAAQIRVFAFLCNYAFDISIVNGIFLCMLFVLSYGIFGGTRMISVNIIFQFYILLIIIPLFSGDLLSKFGGITHFIDHSSIKNIELNFSKINFLQFISMFFIYAIPYCSPAMISIMLMGKNSYQSSYGFLISSFIFLPLLIIFLLIGFLAYVIHPEIHSQISFFYIADHVNSAYKPLLLIGIISIIVSSIDVYLNTGSICLTHDFITSFTSEISTKDELRILKLCNFIIMLCGVLLAIFYNDIFRLINYSHLLWGSIITIPLLMTLIVQKTNKSFFYIPLVFSLAVILIWIYLGLEDLTYLNPIIPSIICSFIVYLTCLLVELKNSKV